MIKKLMIVCVLGFFACACQSIPDTPENFEAVTVETEHFSFRIFQKQITPGKPVRFYIEGNGNPNPDNFVALKMAQNDPSQNVIYLSRPCQFIDSRSCSNAAIYTTAQFHEEILGEMQELTAYLINKYKVPAVEFVGYDGGATIAMLLGTRVPQTRRIITVAGILDLNSYTTHNELKPFNDSLNPADERNIIAAIPQIHYVGGKDEITTKRMAERFVARLQSPRSAVVKVVPSLGHDGWERVQFDYY